MMMTPKPVAKSSRWIFGALWCQSLAQPAWAQVDEPAPMELPAISQWMGPFFFALAILFWVYSAFFVQKATREFRFPEVETYYKRSMLKANLYSLLPALIVGVAFGAVLVVAMFLFGPEIYLPTFGLGIIGIMLFVGLASNWTAMAGNKQLESAVRRALWEQDSGSRGHFIGIAPQKGTPKIDQLVDSHGDIGLLWQLDDRLVIEGMKARWEIQKSDLLALGSKKVWQFALLGARWLVVELRVAETGETRTLRINSRQGSTIRQSANHTEELENRLGAWRSMGPG